MTLIRLFKSNSIALIGGNKCAIVEEVAGIRLKLKSFSRHPSESWDPAFQPREQPTMEAERSPAVYILASRYRGTIYVGVTSELYNRVCNHKNEAFGGFTKQYQVKILVWYGHLPTMEEAIRVEKQIKAWKRNWKIELIETLNPDWIDLTDKIDSNVTYAPPMKAGSQLSLG